MKTLILLTLLILFAGCGGGGASSSADKIVEESTVIGNTKTIAGQELPSGIPNDLDKLAQDHISSE